MKTKTNEPVPVEAELGDFTNFETFARELAQHGITTEMGLRYWLRLREQNGLLTSGAVVEVRAPGSRRPKLLFNRKGFARWLASGAVAA